MVRAGHHVLEGLLQERVGPALAEIAQDHRLGRRRPACRRCRRPAPDRTGPPGPGRAGTARRPDIPRSRASAAPASVAREDLLRLRPRSRSPASAPPAWRGTGWWCWSPGGRGRPRAAGAPASPARRAPRRPPRRGCRRDPAGMRPAGGLGHQAILLLIPSPSPTMPMPAATLLAHAALLARLAAPYPFAVGETLQYEATLGYFPIGTASATVARTTRERGADAFVFTRGRRRRARRDSAPATR